MPNKRVSHEETALTDVFSAIQLERGSSCVCVASIGKQPQFQARMLMARETVDHLKEQVGDAAIFDELRILRSGIDGFIASNPLADKTALQFYATFSNYTRILDQLVPLHRPELPTSPALSAFTKLRDALGEIRAFVCGALALPNESVGHLPRRAFADMVASMHRRRLEHAAVLAATPAPLLPLMSAGLELNPDLATLTEVLLEDFDVAGLREMGRSVGEWWDLITQQLHKTLELQRLYSEELRVEKGVAGLTTASSPMLIRRPTTTDDAALGVSSGGPMRHGHDLSRHDSSKLGGQMMHTMEFAPYESPGPTATSSAAWPRRPSNPSSSPSSSSVTSSAFARSAPLNGEEAGGAYGQTAGGDGGAGGDSGCDPWRASAWRPAADQERAEACVRRCVEILGSGTSVGGGLGGGTASTGTAAEAAALGQALCASDPAVVRLALISLIQARQRELLEAEGHPTSAAAGGGGGGGGSFSSTHAMSKADGSLSSPSAAAAKPNLLKIPVALQEVSVPPAAYGQPVESDAKHEQAGGETAASAASSTPQAELFDSFRGCGVSAADSPPTPAEDLRIAMSELTFERRIGDGGFSTTYKARWERDAHGPKGGRASSSAAAAARTSRVVAVKVAASVGDSVEQWQSEIRALTRLSHPNIVRYLGSVTSEKTRAVVLEFCEAGDLWNALRSPTPPGFTLHVARGLAAALAYLHGMRLMHRDIKSPNVLMAAPTPLHGVLGGFGGTANGVGGKEGSAGGTDERLPTPKLTDFGVSRGLPETSRTEMTAETGTYRWMAPEVLRHEHYAASADIYSWSLVLFECISHEIPFKHLSSLQAAAKVALEGKRPALHPDTPRVLARLIQRCWSRETSDRPSASALVEHLDHIRTQLLTPEEVHWLDDPDGHSMNDSSPQPLVRRGSPNTSPQDHRPLVSRDSSASSPAPVLPPPQPPLRHRERRVSKEDRSAAYDDMANVAQRPLATVVPNAAAHMKLERRSKERGDVPVPAYSVLPSAANLPMPAAPPPGDDAKAKESNLSNSLARSISSLFGRRH